MSAGNGQKVPITSNININFSDTPDKKVIATQMFNAVHVEGHVTIQIG